jgi:hypothetical protein
LGWSLRKNMSGQRSAFDAKGGRGQFNPEGEVGNRHPAQRRARRRRPTGRSYVFGTLDPREDGGERKALVVC